MSSPTPAQSNENSTSSWSLLEIRDMSLHQKHLFADRAAKTLDKLIDIYRETSKQGQQIIYWIGKHEQRSCLLNEAEKVFNEYSALLSINRGLTAELKPETAEEFEALLKKLDDLTTKCGIIGKKKQCYSRKVQFLAEESAEIAFEFYKTSTDNENKLNQIMYFELWDGVDEFNAKEVVARCTASAAEIKDVSLSTVKTAIKFIERELAALMEIRAALTKIGFHAYCIELMARNVNANYTGLAANGKDELEIEIANFEKIIDETDVLLNSAQCYTKAKNFAELVAIHNNNFVTFMKKLGKLGDRLEDQESWIARDNDRIAEIYNARMQAVLVQVEKHQVELDG